MPTTKLTASIIKIVSRRNLVTFKQSKNTPYIRCLSSTVTKDANTKIPPFEKDGLIDTNIKNIDNEKESPLLSNKIKLLQASLKHVPSLGWTEEAIYAGLSNTIPPSTIGLLSSNPSNDLIVHHMQKSNQEFESELQTDNINDTIPIQIEKAIKMRLSKNITYIQSKRWHEAMANGILHPTTTLTQIDEIISIILKAINIPNDTKERVAIGIVYITTELYMLTDTSFEYEDTWRFLKEQMNQLDYFKNIGFFPSSESVVLTSAIISSIGGAVASLLGSGLVRGVGYNSVLSFIMNFVQQQQQTNHSTSNSSDLKYYNEKYYGDLKDVDTTKENGK